MRWRSHAVVPYIPQSINTICHLSWPCPHRPSVLSWTRYSFWRFPYWQTHLAAASASQPWDKSPQRVLLMDGFLKNVKSRISRTLTKAHHQLIRMIININRQCVQEKWGERQPVCISICIHPGAREHIFITFCPRSQHFCNLTFHDLHLIKSECMKRKLFNPWKTVSLRWTWHICSQQYNIILYSAYLNGMHWGCAGIPVKFMYQGEWYRQSDWTPVFHRCINTFHLIYQSKKRQRAWIDEMGEERKLGWEMGE